MGICRATATHASICDHAVITTPLKLPLKNKHNVGAILNEDQVQCDELQSLPAGVERCQDRQEIR